MSPLYDTICEECKDNKIDVWLKINEEPESCEKCGGKVVKQVGCHSFKLVFNNKVDCCSWGCEGYSSSLYHKGNEIDWSGGPAGLKKK